MFEILRFLETKLGFRKIMPLNDSGVEVRIREKLSFLRKRSDVLLDFQT